jgi:hypothetical protein
MGAFYRERERIGGGAEREWSSSCADQFADFVVIFHREKDQLALLHDADEGEASVEIHAALEDVFPQPPDAGSAVRVRLSPRLRHGGDGFADRFAPRLRKRLDLPGEPRGDSNLE